MQRLNRGRAGAGGFTLIELAVVVLVITLLLGSLLIPLATQVDQRNVAETQRRLQEVKEALLGYAMANGRFPCPAEVSVPPALADSGVESFAAGGNTTNGNCKHPFDGYVPGITLGLSNLDNQGFVVDAWGLQQNRIRYAITNATIGTTANAFTAQGQMRVAGIQALGTPAISIIPPGVNLLFICASDPGSGVQTNCGSAQTLSSDAVFVVYSLGKNAATTGGTSGDEAANLNNDPVFVSRVNYSQAAGEFDDVVLWSSRYNVISQLTTAGQLP